MSRQPHFTSMMFVYSSRDRRATMHDHRMASLMNDSIYNYVTHSIMRGFVACTDIIRTITRYSQEIWQSILRALTSRSKALIIITVSAGASLRARGASWF